MKYLPVLLATAVSVLAVPHNYSGYSHCLSNAEAEKIVNKWVSLWRTIPSVQAVSGVVTNDFTFSESDSTLDDNKVAATGISEFKDYIFKNTFDPTMLDSVTVSEPIMFWFASCDRIAMRWKDIGRTTGLNEAKTGIGKGKIVAYKGVDLLHVDLHSRKVKQAETSQDFIHYYDQVGYSVQPKPKS